MIKLHFIGENGPLIRAFAGNPKKPGVIYERANQVGPKIIFLLRTTRNKFQKKEIQMDPSRNTHPYADLFLAVYAELLLRGAWTPNARDPGLPAGVWMNLGDFEAAARRCNLKAPPAFMLLKILGVKPRSKRRQTYPCIFESRKVAGMPRAREHYVELHEPTNPWGIYAPTAEHAARRKAEVRAMALESMAAETARTGWVFEAPEAHIAERLASWEESERQRALEDFGSSAPSPLPGAAPEHLDIVARR